MADINVGAITEALNNKVDLPTPSTPQDAVDYVVEKTRPYICERLYMVQKV